ncbi:DUF262 domain-containing protein [Flammeovirga agarivorans]|uniref:DUF262 domain-containing protein n=1 Tax=Flammeovirga agarivorans TaxID=2726742 RepID=A0A7X8XU15_9BACT|nr:DUF262 domain-containing protein [Flammeovirga agarivorans]NLR89809.1 DUF262 domain-containing protein [Flammeovirga agarivorans]
MSNEKIFNTQVVSLSDLRDYTFVIPTYQRPYVWQDEQIKKLLDDFYLSLINNESVYYVSTILTKEESNVAELIDGQQRFTSLWLIAFSFQSLGIKTQLTDFIMKGDQLKLNFEIRDEVKDYLEFLIDRKVDSRHKNQEHIDSQPYLKNIARRLVFIKSYLEQKLKQENKQKLIEFGDFIYNKVFLVKNKTPLSTDLNKLFSTINSAGVQLEQTDIIKANLLKRLDDKVLYSKIWESCENMNDFFERNVRRSFPTSNWEELVNFENYMSFNKDIFKYEIDTVDSQSVSIFTIEDLQEVEIYNIEQSNNVDEKKRTSEEVYCRSIINFGQLLLHTYRIYLFRNNKEDFTQTFHISNIIEIFKELEQSPTEEIKSFFLLLWDVRYMFDKYIIKWLSDSNTKQETLEIVNINLNSEGYYTRTKYEKSNALMLQSVLYFTGDYLRQYWLTSYLYYLLEKHDNLPGNSEVHSKSLESMDNILSLNDDLTDKELTRKLMSDTEINLNVNLEVELKKAKGTGFKHYWFQKLEYVLWKNWDKNNDHKFYNFRISSKNSVEHIYPQNPENRLEHPIISDIILHGFGNLTLLSVAQNSEYSNKSVSVKKSIFKEKSEQYDSLKSFHIFSYDEWNEASIKDHEEKMIRLLSDHYQNK